MIDERFLLETAQLAYISLEPEEIEGLRSDCDNILSFLNDFREINVLDVKPMVIPWPSETPLRKDTPNKENALDGVMKNAPHALNGYFAIPKFLA